jgi:hypothetical protein
MVEWFSCPGDEVFLLRRRQLVECGDQAWLSGTLRKVYTDVLAAVLRQGEYYTKAYVHFSIWAKKCEAQEVLEIASGSGGPAGELIAGASKRSEKLPKIVLSDLFPLVETYQELQQRLGSERLGYLEQPLDSRDLAKLSSRDDVLPRDCLLCSAFHHFPPEDASRLIQGVLSRGGGLFILEPLSRSYFDLLTTFLFAIPAAMFASLSSDVRSFKSFLFCWVIPIVPCMLWFDGLVSVLRAYRPEEIRAMIPENTLVDFVSGKVDPRSRTSASYCAVRLA